MQAMLLGSEPVSKQAAHWQSSESNEWYTPPAYIEAARRVMGSIDLDPASCAYAQRTVQAVFLCGTRHSEQAAVQKLMHMGCVCITRRRISFYMQDGTQTRPPGNNLFVYLGHRHGQFVAEFGQFGVVLQGAGRA